MKRKAVVLALMIVAGCANAAETHLLDGSYGTLSYSGSVSRQERGADYVYSVRELDFNFQSRASINATDRIVNPTIRFVTTTGAVSGGHIKVTFESELPTHVQLDAEKRKATLRNIVFVVPKAVVASADYAGLSITDGRLLWPMHRDLRD